MFSGTVAFVDSVIFDHLAFVNIIMHEIGRASCRERVS